MPQTRIEKVIEEMQGAGKQPHGVCLLLGRADTGKTTLARGLATLLTVSGPTAVIDADIGQSHIGPPTTVGWAVVGKTVAAQARMNDWEGPDLAQLDPAGVAFVGSVAPNRHLLQFTGAIMRAVNSSRTLADLVIVDTPGFVDGPAAAALWWTVCQVVKPRWIVAVQHDEELSPILSGLIRDNCRIIQLRPPQGISAKSPEQRRRFRSERFAAYFERTVRERFDLDRLATQYICCAPGSQLANRLVALRDAAAIDRVIGVIVDVNKSANRIVVKSPEFNAADVAGLAISDFIVNPAEADR